MRKILVFVILLVIVNIVLYAKTPQVVMDNYDSQFKSRLINLEDKVNLEQNLYSEILATQRQNYNVNVVVLCAIITFVLVLMGLTWFYNFRIAQKNIKEELQKSKNDFKVQAEEIARKILEESKEDYKKLMEYTEKGLKRAQANYYETCGRAHMDMPGIAALWYLRSMELHKGLGDDDKLISKEIDFAIMALGKETGSMLEEFVKEMRGLISGIDSKKFPKEKQDLQEALRKIEEKNKKPI